MMKKLAFITTFANFGNIQCQQISKLFKNHLIAKCYSYDEGNLNQPIDADLFVIALPSLYHAVKKYLPDHAKVITISYTITNVQYDEINKIPAGTTLLVVNHSAEMTMETIALFHHLGINHLDFVPVYPGITNIPKLDIALTPAEPQHVPAFVKQIIDIGHRVVDADTIINIAMNLKLEPLLHEDHFIEYFQSIKLSKNNLTSLFDKASVLESRMLSLLNVMDDGIIVTDNTGIIYACNKKASAVLDEKVSMIGTKIADIIPQIPFDKFLKNSSETDYNLIKINGQNISIKLVPVSTAGRPSGTLTIINRFDEKEKNQHKLRSQLLGKGHKTKYSFADIITQDEAVKQLKLLAEKMAKSDASILITGESGTGKELFSQAIHHVSKRKERQFVAINCAALPESLLESELFGYEEGAFTGARKGGKLGLFEIAHKGTLFLDEIGEMNLTLQARLLRVLEEREVMRLGGDSVIHIDIRIIAATNKDLWHLVEQGKFREDLYYRLNVLPLELPSLRERKDDIPLLFTHMNQLMGNKFQLSPEVAAVLYNHPWHGNIRELRNCVEYLTYLEKDLIEISDIPHIIKKRITPLSAAPASHMFDESLTSFMQAIKFEEEHYRFILDCLHSSYKNKARIGRRSLLKLAQERDLFLTEALIKKMLNQLSLHGLVNLSNGRGGTTITSLGIKVLTALHMIS